MSVLRRRRPLPGPVILLCPHCHAWRTSCRSTTGDNGVKRYYQASLARTGAIRHARLNTQRKLLAVLWTLWRKGLDYDDQLFTPITSNDETPSGPRLAAEDRGLPATIPPRAKAPPGRQGKFRRGTRPAYALGAAPPAQGWADARFS